MRIKCTHILAEQALITRGVGGGSDLNLQKKKVPFLPSQRPAVSVTCTLGEDHTAGRQGSALLAVRWPSLCLQWQQIPAGDAAECWPHTQQCCLWSHSFKAALALMQHLIGRDELFAAAAWGPVLLYTSHYLDLIRSLLPLCVCLSVCVCQHALFTCLNASMFWILTFPQRIQHELDSDVHFILNNWKRESIISLRYKVRRLLWRDIVRWHGQLGWRGLELYCPVVCFLGS